MSVTTTCTAPLLPAEDEKDAILSLLGLQANTGSRTSPEGDRTRSISSPKGHADPPHSKEEYSDDGIDNGADSDADDDKDKGVASPVPGPSLSEEDEEDEEDDKSHDNSSSSLSLRPQAITPTRDLKRKARSVSSTGAILRKIGKKRKHHPTTDNQFEDAQESFFPSFSMSSSLFNQHAQAQSRLNAAGYSPSMSRKDSGEGVPPPPHLIQQTSNEYLRPHSVLQGQNSSDLNALRAALAFPHQPSKLPPHLMATLLGGGVAGAVADPSLLPRMHYEALMLQSRMHAIASRQHNNSNVATGPRAVAAAPSGRANSSVRKRDTPKTQSAALRGASPKRKLKKGLSSPTVAVPSDNISSHDPFEGKVYIPHEARQAFAMRPPSPHGVDRVESDEDPYPPPTLAPVPAGSDGDSDEEAYQGGITPFSTKKNQARESKPSGGFTPSLKNVMSTKLRFQKYMPPPTWGKLCKVPKIPPIGPDDKFENPITTIGEHDVLLGRGGLTNTNPGNIRFRSLISKYRFHYNTAPKGDKGALSRYICNYVRAMNGRFLAKRPVDSEKNGVVDKDAWYEVGDEKAVSKCGQALREGTAEFNKREEELQDLYAARTKMGGGDCPDVYAAARPGMGEVFQRDYTS